MRIDVMAGRVIGAIVLAAGAVLGATVNASPAAANDGTCGGHDFCLWDGSSMTGGRWDNGGPVHNYASGERWWGTTASINDRASSARNRASTAAGLCEHSYGRGACVTVGSNFEINILADYEMDNKASSNIW